MAWAWAFFVVTIVGAVLVLNAFRPFDHEIVIVPSFFAGWYTAEMPVWHIVWQVVATVAFVLAGALRSWPGWAGLVIAGASWVGLVVLAGIGNRSHRVLVRAEEEVGLAPADGVSLPRDGRDTMWRFPRLVYPLPRPARSMRVIRNIDYDGDGARLHRLDVIHRRRDPPSDAPVLVYIHGGAWVIGDKREQGLPLMHELARRGWVAVTVNYRLSPRATWPDHLVDCKKALAWVHENIARYGGDPGFVAVSGGSAGGHLASMLALTQDEAEFQPGFDHMSTKVNACVSLYGVYDMTGARGTEDEDRGLVALLERKVFKTRIEDDPGAFEEASPLRRVHRQAPPFFVLHGANDTLVRVAEARRFVAALRAVSGSPVVFAELPYTQHAFDVLPSVRSAHAVAAIVRFLEAVRCSPPVPGVSPALLAGGEAPGPAADRPVPASGRAPRL